MKDITSFESSLENSFDLIEKENEYSMESLIIAGTAALVLGIISVVGAIALLGGVIYYAVKISKENQKILNDINAKNKGLRKEIKNKLDLYTKEILYSTKAKKYVTKIKSKDKTKHWKEKLNNSTFLNGNLSQYLFESDYGFNFSKYMADSGCDKRDIVDVEDFVTAGMSFYGENDNIKTYGESSYLDGVINTYLSQFIMMHFGKMKTFNVEKDGKEYIGNCIYNSFVAYAKDDSGDEISFYLYTEKGKDDIFIVFDISLPFTFEVNRKEMTGSIYFNDKEYKSH